jgi:hypothetical protein
MGAYSERMLSFRGVSPVPLLQQEFRTICFNQPKTVFVQETI